jgi:hypothetical protein
MRSMTMATPSALISSTAGTENPWTRTYSMIRALLHHRTTLARASKHKARAILKDVGVSPGRQQRSGILHARQGSWWHVSEICLCPPFRQHWSAPQ